MVKAALIVIEPEKSEKKEPIIVPTSSKDLLVLKVHSAKEAQIIENELKQRGIHAVQTIEASLSDTELNRIIQQSLHSDHLKPTEDDTKKDVFYRRMVAKKSRAKEISQRSLRLWHYLTPVVEKTIQESIRLNLDVAICLLDQHGHELFSYRMPDAILISSSFAYKKALTSILLKTSTSQVQKLAQDGAALKNIEAMGSNKIISLPGGLPIFNKFGKLIGAIGVSGAMDPIDDERIASIFMQNILKYYNK